MRIRLSDVIKRQEVTIEQLREQIRRLEFENSVIKKYPTWAQEEVVRASGQAIEALAHTVGDLKQLIQFKLGR